ncbi:MAG: hypothetical protein WD771_07660 [Gemmatimonadaceae bacterium]
MIRQSTIAALVLVALCTRIGATSASAQATPQPAPSGDALARYGLEKKDEAVAALIEAVIPVLGHHYAGDASRGVKPLLVSGSGLLLAIVGASSGCQSEFGGTCLEPGNPSMVALGLLLYTGGRIWGVVSAYNTASEHNRALRERLRLSLDIGRQPGTVGVRFTIATN